MRASRIGSLAAVVGALAWLIAVALVGFGDGDGDGGVAASVCHGFGVVALAVALLAGGYATVATAPAWLRAIVCLAVLLLGWIVLASVAAAARAVYDGTGWFDDQVGTVTVAVLALVAGLVGMARTRSLPRQPAAGGHRATR